MSENKIFFSGHFSDKKSIIMFDNIFGRIGVYDKLPGDKVQLIGELTCDQVVTILRNEFREEKFPVPDRCPEWLSQAMNEDDGVYRP